MATYWLLVVLINFQPLMSSWVGVSVVEKVNGELVTVFQIGRAHV